MEPTASEESSPKHVPTRNDKGPKTTLVKSASSHPPSSSKVSSVSPKLPKKIPRPQKKPVQEKDDDSPLEMKHCHPFGASVEIPAPSGTMSKFSNQLENESPFVVRPVTLRRPATPNDVSRRTSGADRRPVEGEMVSTRLFQESVKTSQRSGIMLRAASETRPKSTLSAAERVGETSGLYAFLRYLSKSVRNSSPGYQLLQHQSSRLYLLAVKSLFLQVPNVYHRIEKGNPRAQ